MVDKAASGMMVLTLTPSDVSENDVQTLKPGLISFLAHEKYSGG